MSDEEENQTIFMKGFNCKNCGGYVFGTLDDTKKLCSKCEKEEEET